MSACCLSCVLTCDDRLFLQYAGWGVAAAVTPAVMGLAGVVFFGATLAAQLPALSPEMAATVAGVGATAGVVTQVKRRLVVEGYV